MNARVLITGVADGLGAALTEAFAGAGWDVFGQDRREPDRRLPLAQFDVFDLADDAVRDAWVARVGEQEIAAIVNNAAEQPAGGATDTGPSEWTRVLHVNLAVPALIVTGALESLASQASIINIASVHAVATTAGRLAYTASKAGLVGLTRSLALELAPNVRVNAILPGAVDTSMLRAGLALAGTDLEGVARRIPLGRVGHPDDVARAALFLADAKASGYITGQTLIVDGGVLAVLSSE